MADYVHLSQTTIAQRAGNVALSETLGVPAAVVPSLQAIARLDRPVQPPPPAKPRIDREALVDALRTDPELLKALIGAAR